MLPGAKRNSGAIMAAAVSCRCGEANGSLLRRTFVPLPQIKLYHRHRLKKLCVGLSWLGGEQGLGSCIGRWGWSHPCLLVRPQMPPLFLWNILLLPNPLRQPAQAQATQTHQFPVWLWYSWGSTYLCAGWGSLHEAVNMFYGAFLTLRSWHKAQCQISVRIALPIWWDWLLSRHPQDCTVRIWNVSEISN